ncbi:MAG: PEP-CTERM-box response regulator transcription factor [Rhodospirillaceae bacterium]|nr:PEP-CTERM-box response regulator transcription factor [Rhodospirillaceae bacterium]
MTEDALKLLLVEDDPGLQKQMRWAISDYEVFVAGDRESALTLFRSEEPPVVVLDLGLPPDPNGASEGLATLEAILRHNPGAKVIIASGNEERGNAVRAIGMGAYDFYSKPVDIEKLSMIIERAWRLYKLEEENRRLTRSSSAPFAGIVTGDPEMQRICHTVEKVAGADVTVLITGESGTGKELLARALHDASPRSSGNFVAVNCAAIPENLLESEMFGYEKGAFTGATKQTIGKVEVADGGTLFLDEIGDMPLSLQAKLLRFLQDRVIERLGGRKPIPVDVRIVCATNQDLQAMMQSGEFREDLYYRLNEIHLSVPPLRDRQGDAVLLARFFLDKMNKQFNKSIRGFSDSALAALNGYNWPGNIRELENRVKKSIIMTEAKVISAEDLELPEVEGLERVPTLREMREKTERESVQRALALAQGNVSKATKLLGISRPTLYDLMKNLQITLKD